MRYRWAWMIDTGDETLYAPSREEVERWNRDLDNPCPVKRVKVLTTKPLKRWTLRMNR